MRIWKLTNTPYFLRATFIATLWLFLPIQSATAQDKQEATRSETDVLYVSNRKLSADSNTFCNIGITCWQDAPDGDEPTLTWGTWQVGIDDLVTVEKWLAQKIKTEPLGMLCEELRLDCKDLFDASLKDLEVIPFENYGLGPEVQPVWFDTPVKPLNMAKAFHTLSFLKAIDDQGRITGNSGLPEATKSIIDRNLAEIFKTDAAGAMSPGDLMADLQDTKTFRHFEGSLSPEEEIKQSNIQPGYQPASLLLHHMTANFRAEVAKERETTITIVPGATEPATDLKAQISSLLKDRDDACKAIMIYVHGYNSKERGAVRDAGYTAQDAGFCGVTIAFSWPSLGTNFDTSACLKDALIALTTNIPTLLMNQTPQTSPANESCAPLENAVYECRGVYILDRAYAKDSAHSFQRLLEIVVEASSQDTPIHVVSHSMGAHVIVSWAEEFLDNSQQETEFDQTRFTSLTLIAPDASTAQFKTKSSEITNKFRKVTIIGTEFDWALKYSGCMHKIEYESGRSHLGQDLSNRLGYFSDPTLKTSKTIHTIDVSPVLFLGSLNHSYQRSNRSVSDILRQILVHDSSTDEEYGHTLVHDAARLEDLLLPQHMNEFWQQERGPTFQHP